MPPRVTRPTLRSKLAISLMSECAFQCYGKVTAMMSLVIRETKDNFSGCPRADSQVMEKAPGCPLRTQVPGVVDGSKNARGLQV